MNLAELNQIVDGVVRATAPAITAKFRGAISSSGLQRKSGRSVRGFSSQVRRDRSTGEVWGVSFRTERYVYMHHHGMEEGSVSRGSKSYSSRGYPKRGMLTEPAAEGARLLADALIVVESDWVVGNIRF
jgi:hypothetical protein